MIKSENKPNKAILRFLLGTKEASTAVYINHDSNELISANEID
jgi:hypothetical protein